MPDPRTDSVSRFTEEAMSTVFEVFIAGKEKCYAGQAARAAFDEINRIERLFSRFDPSSEISRIGRLAPGESVRVGIETAECLTIAAAIQAETGGAFDVNYRARRTKLKGSGRRKRNAVPLPPLFDLIRFGRTGDGFEIMRLPGKSTGLDLDLGAIGKGYALDRTLEVLGDWGVRNALLHAGTSTAIGIGEGPAGRDSGGGWPVGVGDGKERDRIPGEVRLRNRALSGSGTAVKGGHIIEPATGRETEAGRSAWVSHRSGTVADALSTAFAVMSAAEIRDYSARHPDVWGLVIIDAKRCKIFNEDAIA